MGKPGAKKLDQIVSVTPGDIHIIMIPSPGGPVPTPIPHPCTSIIQDKVAETVKVMGQPGAVKGSKSKHTPPHVPMGPGPFQKPPKNSGEIITGSSNVFYEGKAAAMLGDTGLMCADPSDAPVGKVIGTAAMVLVGGGGSGSGGAGSGNGQGTDAGGASGVGPARTKDHPKTGEPIDAVTGALISCVEDVVLDGPLPIQFVRTYVSPNADRRGPLGYGWCHNYQESMTRVSKGHHAWQKIHDEFVAQGNPSPTGTYLLYRDPLGEEAHWHDLPEGTSTFDPQRQMFIGHYDGMYTTVSNPYAQHHFEQITTDATRYILRRIVDQHGNTLAFGYDEHVRLVNVTDVYQRSLLLAYNSAGCLSELTVRIAGPTPQQRFWCQYTYDASGDLTAVTDRGQGVSTYTYDHHLIVESRRANGYSFYFQYDEAKRCCCTWGEDGFLTRHLRYDPVWHVTHEVNGEGESVLYRYDASGRTQSIERMGRHLTRYTYDDQGRIVSRRIGGSIHGELTYDDIGCIAACADGEGKATTFTYDDLGRCVKVTAPDGRVVERDYDERYNLLRHASTGHGEVHNTYDAMGRVVHQVGPADAATYHYDAYGHLAQVERTSGLQVATTYDPFGRLLEWRLDGYHTRYEWDALDRPVKEIGNGITVMERRFDCMGRLVWERDVLGRERQRIYQGAHLVELRPWHDPQSGRIPAQRYTYDTEGRLRTVADETGILVRLSYNNAGQVQREEFSTGWSRWRAYNEAGQLATLVDNAGHEQILSYNGAGQVCQIQYADQSTDVFEHDATGRIVAATAGESVVTFELNAAGQVMAATQDGWAYTATFNAAWQRVTLQVEGFAQEVHYTYGPDGRLSAVHYGDLTERFAYTPDGRLQQRHAMNGLVECRRYDTNWRLQERSVQDATGRQVYRSGLSYDRLGRIAAMEDSRRGRRRFGYNEASHLIAVDWDTVLPGRVPERYTFDNRGSLQAVQDCPVPPLVTTNGHCLDWLADQHGASCQLVYDAKDQLIAVHSANGQTWQYRYDAFGRRTRKIQLDHGVETARWEYLWDMDVLLAERYIQGEHQSQRLYLCHGLTVYARIDEDETGQQLIVYHPDHLETPDVCTDASGAIVWQRDNTAFGARHNAGVIAQYIGFPGQYWDAESALFYNRHRHYDPQAARYLQPDPLGVTAGWHPHRYPTNPLILADPLGLAEEYSIDATRPTAYRILHNDRVLFDLEDNTDDEDRTIHRFKGQSQGLATSLGKHIPRHIATDVGNSLAGVEQLVIDGHGFPGGVAINGQPINGRQLAEKLLAHGFQGDTVVLVVCHAAEEGQRPNAAGSGSLAQDVADELKGMTGRNIKVIGASGTVINNGDGTLMAGKEVFARSGHNLGWREGHEGATFSTFVGGQPPRPAPGNDYRIKRVRQVARPSPDRPPLFLDPDEEL